MPSLSPRPSTAEAAHVVARAGLALLGCVLVSACSVGPVPGVAAPEAGNGRAESSIRARDRRPEPLGLRLEGPDEVVVQPGQPTEVRWALTGTGTGSWSLDRDGLPLVQGEAAAGATVSHTVDTAQVGDSRYTLTLNGSGSAGSSLRVRVVDAAAPRLSGDGTRTLAEGERAEIGFGIHDHTAGRWVLRRAGSVVAHGTFAPGGDLVTHPADTSELGATTHSLTATDAAGLVSTHHTTVRVGRPLTACGRIERPGEYVLTQDVSAPGTCFRIAADGVVLDCQGHAVRYGTRGSGVGVHVGPRGSSVRSAAASRCPGPPSAELSGVVVVNCSIEKRGAAGRESLGVFLDRAGASEVAHNTVRPAGGRGGGHGIVVSRGRGNTVEGNSVETSAPGSDGLRIIASEETDGRGNTVALGGTSSSGISLLCADRTVLAGNTIRSTRRGADNRGIRLRQTRYGTLSDNQIDAVGDVGLALQRSDGNVLTRNAVTGNALGIEMAGSADNLVYDNVFRNDHNATLDADNAWSAAPEERRNILGGPVVGGNSWSDYAGEDETGDGLGDTRVPYIGDARGLPEGAGDRSPLTPSRVLSVSNRRLGARVDVEAYGALDVTISPSSDPTQAAYGMAAPGLVGQIVDLQASGDFEQATVELAYDEAALGGADEASVRLYWWDEDAALWQQVPGSHAIPGDGVVVGHVSHFTPFGPFNSDDLDLQPISAMPNGAGAYAEPDEADWEAFGCAIASSHGKWETVALSDDFATKNSRFRGCYDEDQNPYVEDQYVVAAKVYTYYVETGFVPTDDPYPPLDAEDCAASYDVCGKLPALLTEQHCGAKDSGGDHDGDGIPNAWDEDHPKYGIAWWEYVDCTDVLGPDGICLAGRCILESQVFDLYVGQIPGAAASTNCQNYYTFEICNAGSGTVSEPFQLLIEANGEALPWTFTGAIPANDCVLFEEPSLMHIFNFGVALGETADVTVVLDVADSIDETDESNNEATALVFAGDDFTVDGQIVCNTTCAETDGGKNKFLYGENSYVHNGVPGSNDDYCYASGSKLAERFCKMIVPLPNGLFSDPKGLDYIDCVHVFEPAGRCVKGACVPADAAPTCIDWEGMADPTVQGTIDTTDFDADADSKTDQCKEYCLEVCALGVCETVCEESEEVLTEWYCDGAQEMGENKKVSCYHLDPPHVCQDGACVPYEGEDCSECSRPDDPSADPYVSGTLMEVKLQCEEVERPDTCASSTKVKQWVCSGYNGMIPEWKTHDCSADGALCKDGACVMADESLKECIETGDVGVDPDTSGQYQVTNAVGVTSNGGDHCGATGTLFEYYCDDDEVKMVLVDCEDSGKTCVAGACQ